MHLIAIIASLLLMADVCFAGVVNRPAKSFGGTQYVNGVVPQDTDFNGDFNTIYGEFNGNITNANIGASAAIAATKLSPDGFTVNVRTVNAAPCTILEESDQSADAKRWATCLVGGELRISTLSDLNVVQDDWFKIARANGSVTMGGASGTNTINGPTTFNHTVTFTGGTSLTPTGMITAYVGTSAPAGWLLMDGGTYSCTGASSANANLCELLVAQVSTVNYKGGAAGTFTVDTSSNEIIDTAHGKSVGDRVHFTTTTTLPSPLSGAVVYCIISTSTDRFKISTTCGGAEVDITTNGSGTHSDYFNFITPDARGRNLIGTGTGSGLSTRVLGAVGGEQSHQLTTTEMPAHTHNYNVRSSTGVFGSPGANGWDGVSTNGGTTTSAGSNGSHNVMDPFLVMTYIIKL